MSKTVTFVTNQYSCDRIIYSARVVADQTKTDLVVVGILDSEYEINPEVVDYLFVLSKKNQATMRLVFSENKMGVMRDIIGAYDHSNIVTGMPSNNQSVLYRMWKDFPDKKFFTVDTSGELVQVAGNMQFCTA